MTGGWRTVSVNRALLTSHISSVSGCDPTTSSPPSLPPSPSPAADSSPFSSLHCEHVQPNKSTLQRDALKTSGAHEVFMINNVFLMMTSEINDWRETSWRLFCPSAPRRRLHTSDTWSRLVKLTWHYYGLKGKSVSLSLLSAADVSLFNIIHRAFFDPRCQLSQKHISGFYRHFYRHTWRLPYKKGHKLKYYECWESARHLFRLAKQQPCCIFIII